MAAGEAGALTAILEAEGGVIPSEGFDFCLSEKDFGGLALVCEYDLAFECVLACLAFLRPEDLVVGFKEDVLNGFFIRA